jgi:hypothetical protein
MDFSHIGEKHGRLTIMGTNPYYSRASRIRPTHSFCHCKCECGKEVDAFYWNLKKGVTRSCGCLRREHHHRLGQGAGTRRRMYRQYKRNAQRSGVDFSLTFDVFCQYIGEKCYYCGEQPGEVYWKSEHVTKEWGTIKANGIDRINSKSGYSIENIVPCCKTCNYMKQEFTQEEFLGKVKLIYEKHFTR